MLKRQQAWANNSIRVSDNHMNYVTKWCERPHHTSYTASSLASTVAGNTLRASSSRTFSSV